MPIATILILFAFFVISSSLGIAWGVYQRQNSAEKLERSEAYRRRTLHLSDQLHNSVANDLVYLDHLILSSGHELDESLIIEARTTISEALGKVHQVIDEATF
jgi:ABC-type transport system involved in cytochrome c biogenesis permease subunit